MDYLKITFRVFFIMGLLLFLVLTTGRRKIGELPVFDFLAIIILGNVVGADIADPKVPQLPTAYAILLIVGIQYLLSRYTIKSRKFGRKVTFSPTVVIQNGQFIKSNMKKLKYSVDNIQMYLREKGIFDINEVEFAIVEDSGNVSVMKKSQFQPLTPYDMNITTNYKGISLPLIIDGSVYENNLTKLNLDKVWLQAQLKLNAITSFDEAFYVDINTQGKLYVSKVAEPKDIIRDFV
ncbi:DUF421 domain-containing protein [Alkalibaculum sp. M08DMB]|uniref:DUF421 domain-containing protein n=1 Tax=Alkalibaculum sporogenes TaxID=2655001 RepID=A0A6A7K8L5_9FIRM|nr:DUF421 domain-containing protein [Alkalibaculum sporogenes]MPW25537.1 DUF421 domain-containing protein [Alkalibaculum sporogenes]